MKTINFSIKEILSSLLDKSKTQTIRPAWKDKLKCFWCDDIVKDLVIHVKKKHPNLIARSYDLLGKPLRFKVGDKVKLYWKQRSKYTQFCKKCGSHKLRIIAPAIECFLCLDCKYEMEYPIIKVLGTVEITEVFKIEVNKTRLDDMKEHYFIRTPFVVSKENLAKRDGFKSAEDMFKTLDKMYDLSSPKEFYVYRWKW